MNATLSSSPAVDALRALLDPAAPTGPASLAEVARHVQTLSVAQAIGLGFSFASTGDHTGERQIHPAAPHGLPRGALTLMLSPAREVALPVDAQGASLAEPTGGWVDERFFTIELIAADHPAQDWSRPSARPAR